MPKELSSWWVYQNADDLVSLRALRGVLDSISLNCHPAQLPPTFVADCRGEGMRVLQLVNHHAGDYLSAEERKRTVDQILSDVQQHGFDGVDLDYEFQPEKSRESFSQFLQELAGPLHHEGKTLSICVGFYPTFQATPPNCGFMDPVVVGKVCDQVRVMGYDQNFAPGKGLAELMHRQDCQSIGPTSTQPFLREALEFWAKYAPTAKLVAGLPAYGNDYSLILGGGGTQVPSNEDPCEGRPSDRSWLWLEKTHFCRYFDDGGQPRGFFPSDEESTRALLATVAHREVPAISFWHAGLVTPEMWQAARDWKTSIL